MPKYKLDNKNKKAVISLGGSLINPGEIAVDYLKDLKIFLEEKIEEGWEFIIVTGGGALARWYIDASAEIVGDDILSDDMDWLGIHATRFNAHLIRTVFRKIAQPTIIMDPEKGEINSKYPIIIGSGWKPGWSTDYVAAKIAERTNSPYLINLSNIKQVFRPKN